MLLFLTLWYTMVRFISTWVWPLLAAIFAVVLIYLLQRPRIQIEVKQDEKPNLQFGAKFVHIFVRNNSLGIFGGGTAIHCKGTIKVVKPGKTEFVTKWATRRDPVSVQYSTNGQFITTDLVGIEESKYEDIFPGETKRLDVAIKWDGEDDCYIHEPENFLPKFHNRRNPEDVIHKGEFNCTVTIECASPNIKKSHNFKLVNKGSSFRDFNLREADKAYPRAVDLKTYRFWRAILLVISITLLIIALVSFTFDRLVPYFFGWVTDLEMVLGTTLAIILLTVSFNSGFEWWMRRISNRFKNSWVLREHSVISFLVLVGCFGIAVGMANLVVGHIGKEYTISELFDLILVVVASFLFLVAGLYSGHRRSSAIPSKKKVWETLIESVLLLSIVIAVLSIVLFYIKILTTTVFWVTIVALWLSVFASSDTISREISMSEEKAAM